MIQTRKLSYCFGHLFLALVVKANYLSVPAYLPVTPFVKQLLQLQSHAVQLIGFEGSVGDEFNKDYIQLSFYNMNAGLMYNVTFIHMYSMLIHNVLYYSHIFLSYTLAIIKRR